MRRTLLAVLLLPLAACQDTPARLLAPEAPLFVQMPANPVVNSLLDSFGYAADCTAARCTLRDAIAFAQAGGTITFSVTGTITLTRGELQIAKDLTINGPGVTSLRVSGNNHRHVFDIFSSSTTLISGLTITEGLHAGPGGGIRNDGTLTLRNSIISGNLGVRGGGIFNDGVLTLENSTVSGNRATVAGGGIENRGVLTLRTSTVAGNTGGGSSSAAAGVGGGIHNLIGARLIAENSTISGNSATQSGGGIENHGVLTLRTSTVADNTALMAGGGIMTRSTLTLQNSILANNTASNGGDCFIVDAGPVTDGGYNLVQDGSCISASTSQSGEPLLGPLQDNGGPTWTHALLPGSPALDAIPFGSNGCGIGTDQRRFPRPQGGACDIGAFEFQPPTITLGIAASGTLSRQNGVATLSGTVTCSAPVTVTVNVSLSQQQTKGKTTTTVSGGGSTSVACSGPTAWTVAVTPTSGKFVAGAADAVAEVAGASPPVRAEQTVQLR